MDVNEFLEGYYIPRKTKKRAYKSALTEKYKGQSVLGVTCVMHNGRKATCVEYRNARDIDVEFEDGAIVQHKSKKNFLLGGIEHPSKYETIVGVRVEQPGGYFATCIEYNGWDDIDIQFDDGVIIEHRLKREFLAGSIRHPSFYSGYVGQKLQMTDGRPCTCIAYHSAKNIVVKLDDGAIVGDLTWQDLYGWKKVQIGQTKSIVGTVAYANCGMNAMCIADRGYYDIDIKFDDGTVVEHVPRGTFLKGLIPNPNVSLIDYPSREQFKILGMRKRMNCGFFCTVVEYVNARDMTVKFDDGSVVSHCRRDCFFDGKILHPKLGTLWAGGDSIAQRLLYYYISRFYKDVGYSVRPKFLEIRTGRCYELDIYIGSIGVGIEFDGAVQGHFDENIVRSKNAAIERASEIKKLYVVIERDKRIKFCRSPKVQNIFLTYDHADERLYDVYEAAKIILEDLGNDVSSLEWNADIIPKLYEEGISVCRTL